MPTRLAPPRGNPAYQQRGLPRLVPGLLGMVRYVKRYKYSALVKFEPMAGGSAQLPLPESGGRVVVRAQHHETHHGKMFTGVVAPHGEPLRPGSHSVRLTMTVMGDDAHHYLEAGDSFALWRGHDIGHGVISRRLLMWTEST